MLERMLTKFTASYKLYWFKAIFDDVIAGNTYISFKRAVGRMVASAWYPVVYFRLNLGATDKLADFVDFVHREFNLAQDCKQDIIIDLVSDAHSNCQLDRHIASLTTYVPYRLIRPFYEERISHVNIGISQAKRDSRIDGLIRQFNAEDIGGAPYCFTADGDGVRVVDEWATYLCENEAVIRGWLNYKLIEYLQARNPSTPAISRKLYPPVQRDLSAAHAYWNTAMHTGEFREIYNGELFNTDNFERYGALSIDHFIPWSFVLHDEPWNLIPTFKNVNSRKNDRLPDFGRYKDGFCDQQFDALVTVLESKKHRKYLESYLSIDTDIFLYERTSASRDAFTQSLENAIGPLYQIALNQGYPKWEYEYAVVTLWG